MTIKWMTAAERQTMPATSGHSRVAAFAAWVRGSADRARQRRALAQLSDFNLRDIGLTRRDVADETAKPFWKI